jgi:hypothetical protein
MVGKLTSWRRRRSTALWKLLSIYSLNDENHSFLFCSNLK